MVARVIADSSRGMGAYLALARFHPEPNLAQDTEAWLTNGILEDLSARTQLTGASAIAVELKLDHRMTRAFGQEPDPMQIPEWGVLVEGTDPNAALVAAQDALGNRMAELSSPGTAPVFETWRFLYANQRLSDNEKA